VGVGFWGLVFGFWVLAPTPKPPIPNPQSPIPILFLKKKTFKTNNLINLNQKIIIFLQYLLKKKK